jgi:hypothetical protein
MATQIQIGQAANLLFGYQPIWDPNSAALPFFAAPTPSVKTTAPQYVPAQFPDWDNSPTITIHQTAEGLVSAIYKYKVARLAQDPAGLQVPSGQLALDDADSASAIAAVGKFLGLDLSSGSSYMLVTMQRISSTATHPFVSSPSAIDRSEYLTSAAAAAIGKLKPAQESPAGSVLYESKITKSDADQYVDAIYQLGTHFVSEITAGDLLLQVFAYAPKQFAILQASFASDATTQPDGSRAVTGSTATSWAYYTTTYDGTYGFAANYGQLLALSRDAALTTAIQSGAWANGYVPPKTPSIFAGALNNGLMVPLTKSVPIALTLTPVAALITNLLIASPWDRLVKGGLLQKYGDAVRVPLTRQLDFDWNQIFPDDVASWASNIVTPTVDIYQERVDLAKVNLQGGPIVAANFAMQSFTSFSQVLQATTQPGDSPVELPSDNITLVAQIIDMTQAVQTPVLSMSATALQNLTVACEDMYGALIFEAASSGVTTRKVALDGFLFETQSTVDPTTKRFVVDISGVLTDSPAPKLISQLKQSIQFSIVAGESLLHSRGTNAETVRKLEQSYLLWLAGIIPADTTDIDLANNRMRALYLAHNVGTFSSDAVYVPYVKYESYQDYVTDMVGEAQTLTQQVAQYQIQITDTINAYKVMDSIDNLNNNIKQIGGVLTSYFQVLVNGQQAMGSYYDSILAELDAELQSTLNDITSLSTKLSAQQAVISQTANPPGIVQKFQQDYADYSKDLIAQAVISGVEGLFSLGLSMAAIPSAGEKGALDALKAIKDVYDKLQAVMKVLSSLKAVEKIANDINKINELSGSIATLGGQGNLQMPSQVDLQLLGQNVQAALANVPNTGSLNQDKANLIAAVNSLVIIGTALLEAQTKASQILMQISNNNRLKTINGQQQQQLAALTTMLHLSDSKTPPDVTSLNLIGVTGQLQFQLKQVLTVLAQTLELQDGAIQYEYFGQPTPITSFSLLNLQTVISTQAGNIINALQQLNPPPQKVDKPIKIVVKDVLATKLSGTNVFQFPIHLRDPAFMNYDMVRIDRVLANVSGIKSTTSGNYEVHLTCQAKPFQDRDYNRTTMTFASVQREFGPYVYNASTGVAEFGQNTGTFADKVSHLTPFSLWQISLPGNVQNNQGIVFDSLTVDVELDFYITAHYDDRTSPSALARRRAMSLAAPEAAALLATGSTAPSLPNLEAQMYQNQAVLQNWDAVFNVLEGPVNAFLYQQFQQYISKLDPNNSDNLMQVSAYYCDSVEQFRGTWFTNVTKMTFKLSNPLLQFVAGNDSVTVVQNILSGSVTNGTMEVTATGFDPSKCHLIDGTVNFTANTSTSTLTLSVDGVFESNMQVQLTSTGTLPAPLQPATDYWIIGWASSQGTTTLQLSATAGGAAISLTTAGSGTHTIAPDIEWSPPNTVVVTQNPYVQGSVALAKVSGIVTPPSGGGSASETHTVILDFPSGAFTLNQFAVNPPNWDPTHHAINISNALANFYATHEIKYQVQTINYTNLSNDVALQPSKFVLNAITTNAGNNILQMLIATTGQVQHATTITLDEPIPYDPANPVPGVSDFMVSLMISSELMFEHIFVSSFNQGGTNLHVKAVDPGKSFEAWSAIIDQGSATGNASFQNPYDVDGTQTNFRINSSSNDITWSLVGLTFDRSPAAGVGLNYSNGSASTSPPTGGTSVSFQYQQWIPPQSAGRGVVIPGHWGSWQDASAMAYINMSANYPLEVTGSGRQQTVSFSTVEPTVNFSKASDLQPATGCHCNDNAIKIALLNSLGTSVPATLKTYMQEITFNPISVFALENLLFPADQLINLQSAVVPGDLLVVGSFLAQVRKKTTSYNVTISAATGAQGQFGGTSFANGQGTGSVTQSNLPAQIVFSYGPINPAIGGMVAYTLNLETGAISPPLMVVVDQPDPDGTPATVILLPPGFGPGAN